MPLRTRTVQISGADAKITSINLFPQADGSVVVVVNGVAQLADGSLHSLKDAQLRADPSQRPVLADFLALGLRQLRTVNGLED